MKGKSIYFPCVILAATVVFAGGIAMGDVYDDLVTYDWNKSRTTLSAIEQNIRQAATPDARKAIETKLLKALAAPNATYACKQFVCRMLRRIGSDQCIPALAKLLPDPKLSHMARFALERHPSRRASRALREAMPTLDGKLKIGVIASLGARRSRRSVADIAKLMTDDDENIVRAAIRALGNIGSNRAAKALADAKVSSKLKTVQADARLMCADRMLARGRSAPAAAIYREMFAKGNPKMIRIAALRGIALSEKENAAKTLLGLMNDKDVDLRRAAGKFVVEMPGKAATKAFAAELASMPSEAQILLINALTARGDCAAAPEVTKLIGSKNGGVRIAAINALSIIGDASSVPVLAKAAASGGKVGDAAVNSLNRIKGEGVSEAMSNLMDSRDPALRAGIMKVLAVRADKTMAPVMVKAARDKDERIRMAAIQGLAAVGGQKELPAIVALLLDNKNPAERSALAKALASSAMRVTDTELRTAAIISGMDKADADAKVRMLNVLGRLGGKNALGTVRRRLKASNAEVRTEAIRALQSWPDAAPAPDLLRIIKTTSDSTHRALAFRGYIRMASMPDQRGSAETAKMYQQALKLASNAAEKKSVLSGMAVARSADALKLVEAAMADNDVKAEAEVALVQIAGNARDAAPEQARAALNKVIATTKNAGLRDKAKGIINEMDKYRGYVTSWLISGPYTGGSAFDTAYPPEKKDAKNVKWQALTKGVGPQILDLAAALGGNNRAAYMKTSVWSPADQDVRLELGSDDGIKVWIDDKLVHAHKINRGIAIAQDKVDTRLKKGWNRVLVKVANSGGGWSFCFRICKRDGGALDGLKASIECE